MYLLELGMEPTESILKESAELIFSTWQGDGRFRLYPKALFTHTLQSMPLIRFAIWDLLQMPDFKKLSSTFYRYNMQMVVGAVINSALVGDRKQTIQIRYQHLLP